MNKRVLSLVLALVMILTMVPMTAMAASVSDFSDVEQGKWYYTWIDNVAKEGYYAGYTDGTFRPNETMTRAMFVMVLANMEEAELNNSTSAFKDVEAGKWYTGATKWASDNKIVAGYTDGTFKPDAIVTREQMATIMQNYINWRSAETGEIHETDGSTEKFADDAKISKYAKEAVANCREWDLIAGYTDGTFRPQNGSTRAEVAAVISKLAWMVMGGGPGNRVDDDDDEEIVIPKNDFLYWAAYDAAEDFEANYKDYVNNEWKGSELKLGDITVKDEIVNGARPQEVTLTGKLTENAVKELGQFAIDTAVTLIDDGNLTEEEVEDVVKEIVAEIEAWFDIDIFKGMTVEDLADQAWDKVEDASYLWDYFHNGEGAYYTGDVTISVGDAETTLTVDEVNNKISYNEDKWEVAKDMAVAIAEELYDSLKEASNGQYITEAEVNFVLDIDFSVPTEEVKVTAADAKDRDGNTIEGLTETTYADNIKKFPTSYPVTVTLDLQNPDIDCVAYKFVEGKGNFIKLTAYEADYVKGLEEVVEYALSNPWVKDKAEELVEGSIEEIQSNDVFEDVIDALAEFMGNETAARNIADTYIRIWTNDNMDIDNLYESPVFDMLWNDKDAEDVLDNEQIYDLVTFTADKAALYAKGEIEDSVSGAGWGVVGAQTVEIVMRGATPEYVKSCLDNTGVDLEVDSAIENYICAVVADKLREISNSMYIENFAAAKRVAMENSIDELIAENVVKAIEDHENYDELQEALKVKDVDNLLDATLGDLAAVLDEYGRDEVERVDEFVDEFVEVFKNIPDGASVSFGNKVLNVNLDDVKNAVDGEEVLNAAIELLEDPALKNLCIREFKPEDGQKITVAGDDYSYSLNLVIEVK